MFIYNSKKINMAEEEKDNNTTITSDDVDALRILLHNVKGISAVSAGAPPSVSDSLEE
jgi:hypothetical protein